MWFSEELKDLLTFITMLIHFSQIQKSCFAKRNNIWKY